VAVATERAGAVPKERLTAARVVPRAVVAGLIAAAVLAIPLLTDVPHDQWVGLAVIYAIIGLSINVITGHAGQISLGHQAFVGIGAFTSAYFVGKGLTFYIAVPVAGLTGAFMSFVLGLAALRIRGLYLALITLSFGLMAETSVFSIRGFTGGGAGKEATRPPTFLTNQAYAYLCFLVLAFFLLVDWRLVKTKVGRAIVSVRNDERVAATLGINVVAYKLFAFMIGGFIAGVAGALFAHWNQFVNTEDFSFFVALTWIGMAVVGGLGSRAGVVISSAFIAVFPLYIGEVAGGSSFRIPGIGDVLIQILPPFIIALLIILTLTRFPGGIGQQLAPLRRWLAGGDFRRRRHAGELATEAGGTFVEAAASVETATDEEELPQADVVTVLEHAASAKAAEPARPTRSGRKRPAVRRKTSRTKRSS
jgi:branched-chain amino acid transport system permease protein